MMNSLGYDATLETASSPFVGVQNKWVAPVTSGTVTPGSAEWINEDLNTDGSGLIDSAGTTNK